MESCQNWEMISWGIPVNHEINKGQIKYYLDVKSGLMVPHISALHLRWNDYNIEDFPTGIENCHFLQEFDLVSDKISIIPEGLRYLSILEVLILNLKKVRECPEWI